MNTVQNSYFLSKKSGNLAHISWKPCNLHFKVLKELDSVQVTISELSRKEHQITPQPTEINKK